MKGKKKRKKIFLIIASIIGILVIASGGYSYYLFNQVKVTANKMHESVDLKKPHKSPNSRPISILLMGVDERSSDNGRSDTLIEMTLNPSKGKMQMISIPRDTRTEIVGHGTTDKINHAYAFGGTKMAVETVEAFTGVSVDYYIRVNMAALSSLVDAVGGITVQNDLDWIDEGYYKKGYHYAKGNLELDGPKALGYVRMRHLDPNGDFGRNKRQRQIIAAIVDKTASITSVTRLNDILAALGDNVKTNMTFADMTDISKNYRNCRNDITQYEVKGLGGKIGGIYYLSVPDEEKAKVTNMLKENLENS